MPARISSSTELTDKELDRYSRHLLLDDFTIEHQRTIRQAQIGVIGCGGLGGLVAMQLAAAGVGRLDLFDEDSVEVSNLQRQLFFTTDDLGRPKTQALGERIKQLNPHVNYTANQYRFPDSCQTQPKKWHIIIDCTDNFKTRFAINRWSLQHKVPLISGAAIEYQGLVGLLNTQKQSPCYQCIFSEESNTSHSGTPSDTTHIGQRCADLGVINSLLGVISSLQSHLALEFLRHSHAPTKIWQIDLKTMQMRSSHTTKDPFCSACYN